MELIAELPYLSFTYRSAPASISACATPVRQLQTAHKNAVLPSRSLTLESAPADSNNFASWGRPSLATCMSAVQPRWSCAFTLTPSAISRFTDAVSKLSTIILRFGFAREPYVSESFYFTRRIPWLFYETPKRWFRTDHSQFRVSAIRASISPFSSALRGRSGKREGPP